MLVQAIESLLGKPADAHIFDVNDRPYPNTSIWRNVPPDKALKCEEFGRFDPSDFVQLFSEDVNETAISVFVYH